MAKASKTARSGWSSLKKLLMMVWRPVRAVLGIVLRPLRPLTRPIVRYLRGVRQEFKRVNWPKRGMTWRLTLAVVIFSVIFAAFVAAVDYGLNVLFEKVIIKG